MNLWLVNHYAGLPATVPATRPYDLAKGLTRLGHRVTILACSFNHYTLIEEQLKPAQLYRIQESEGVRIVWVRGTSYQKNDWRRLLNMLVFATISLVVGVFLTPKPDLIIGTTVHPLAPMSAFFISCVRRARFWVDITDIWPESLIDLGHITAGGLKARFLSAVERFSLRRAEVVTSVLPNIAEYLRDNGLPDKRSVWTPNGIDKARLTSVVEPAKNGNPSFTAMYAGGFAPAHALEVILDAAAIIQANEQANVRFVLIGDGPEMSLVRRKIESLDLSNVFLTGAIPKQDVYERLRQADVLLCTARNLSVYKYGVSFNKISDYLLAGRPIIFAINSHNDPVADAGAGLSVPAESPQALADAVVELSKMPSEVRSEMGSRGRRFVLSEFDYAGIASRLDRLF